MEKSFTVYQNDRDSLLISLLGVARIRAELIGAPIVAQWNVTLKPKK